MGGGYIECGKFRGSDKSGSALFGVFEAIQSMLPASEQNKWKSDFLAGIEAIEDEQMISISPQLVHLLIGPLQVYYEQLRAKLGTPDPADAIAIDAKNGMNPTKAKWGAGDGWRYYCAHDLLKACEISIETGEPITISFD